MSKKIIVIVSSIAAAIVLFAGGFYCGLRFFVWTFNTTEIAKTNIEFRQLQSNIEALDNNDADALRTNLNLRSDVAIMKLYNMLEESKNGADADKAKKLLTRMAKHRKQFPPTYPKLQGNAETVKTQQHIAAILAEFEEHR